MPNFLGFPPYSQQSSSGDQYNYHDLPPELALEHQALNRKQQIANMLIEQGLQPAQGQMVGGWYVPASPLQGLAGLAQIAAGKYASGRNDDARRGLVGKNNQMMVDAMQGYKNATADKTTTTELEGPGAPVPTGVKPGDGFTSGELAQPTALHSTTQEALDSVAKNTNSAPFFKEGPRPTSTTTTPRTPDEIRQAIYEHLAMSQVPQAQRMGQFMLGEMDRKDAGAEKLASMSEDRAVRREGIQSQTDLRLEQMRQANTLAQMQIDSREAQGKDATELKRELANQTNELKRMELGTRNAQLQQGKIPPGYRQKDGNLEAIPGGPADQKLQGALNTDTAMLTGSNAAFDRLGSSANALLNHPGLAGITGLRGKIPNIPGSAAADAEAQLNTLKSQVGFGVMQELRNNSKSGSSGLGALSDAEGKRLENNLAALDKAQSIDQMKSSLKSIVDYSGGAKDRLRETFNMKHKQGEPAARGNGPKVGAIEDGHRFKGGDPSKQESWEKVK